MFIGNAGLEDGKLLLILGLSARNIELLKQGRPIDLSRESHGMAIPPNLKIMIFAGGTEEEMRIMMSGFIGPTTVVDQKKPQ